MSCIIIQITTTGSADNSLSTVSNDNTLYVDSFNVHFQITEEPQYFTAITVKKTTTALQKEEWEMMGGGHSTLSKDWKEVITSKLEIVNPYCSFAYSWRWKKKNCSRKHSDILFRCRGRCSFSDCYTTFTVTINSDMEMTTEFSGTIRHRIGDTKARNITTPQRQKLRAELQHELPSTLRAKRYLSLSHPEYMSGKRDSVGRSASVYQKISSEGNLEKQAAGNVILSIMKLREKLIETDKLSRIHQGYIHHITAVPFGVILFTELGLRIYHQLSPLLTVHCDATGTIVQTKEFGKILYYALVLRHPEEKSPVAVAEFITASQSVLAFSYFLESFRRAEAIMYGYGNLSVPFEVLIDRSIVLLISFLKVFNNESLSSYLHRCFRLVMNCSNPEDSHLLMVHACISHVMNSVKKDIKKLL